MDQFALPDGVLCRNVTVHDAHVTQLVVPESLIPVVLQLIHDTPQPGHPGRDKSLAMAHCKKKSVNFTENSPVMWLPKFIRKIYKFL